MKQKLTDTDILNYLTREVLRNEEIWGKNSYDAKKSRERRENYIAEHNLGKVVVKC